ncbi:MAG: HD domain-containing protein [archaeon]|jgi:uncharacterized protein
MKEAVIENIKNEAKTYFSDANGCHAWDHTERVLALCMHIGKKEHANLEVLELSAILHDICKPEEIKLKGTICHATKGAEIAGQILKKYGFPQEKINAVVHCIESHRTRTDKKPSTLEAKILYDSDKIDGIGAIGIGRDFMCASEIGAKLHNKNIDIEKTKPYTEEDTAYREYLVKHRFVKDKVFTTEGKRIANERHKFMEEFFERMNKEVDGEL